MRIEGQERQQKDGTTYLPEYVRTLWRKRYFVLLPLLLSGFISVIGVRFIKPVYMSSSLILMENKNYLSDEVPQLVPLEERRQAIDEETLAKITSEIQSSDFLDLVIDHLGVGNSPKLIASAREEQRDKYPSLSVEELVARRLRELLVNKVEVSLAGPGMFEISCFDYSPETCYLLADAVTSLFIESQQREQLRGLQQASEFSDEQIQVYKARLEASEAELEQIQNKITRLALQSNPVGETSSEYAEEFGGEANLRHAEILKEQLDIQVAELEGGVDKTRERLVDLVGRVPTNAAVSEDGAVRELRSTLNSQRLTQLRLELASSGVTRD
ncbi:MAG: hypothetical protein JSW58_17325, partial [Candidatus Latescibacterota bacterium]